MDGIPLSERDFNSYFLLLVVAGNETTRHTITHSMNYLMQNPDQLELLQERLHAANDLHLTLKHVHGNVVGPHFISVPEMIDPQVDAVRGRRPRVRISSATAASRVCLLRKWWYSALGWTPSSEPSRRMVSEARP